ncbi:glycosyltransferase family 4 protein [Patescibacteria group bacterium]|nr:glycosyltransferase family 4 protein [Patescibacteria group bacterium]
MLVSDVRGWAFDQNFHDLEEYLSDRFDFEHAYVWEWQVDKVVSMPDFKQYDVVFCPYHRWGYEAHMPWGRTLGALRAQWLFPERKRRPGREEFDLVNWYAAFQVVTRVNYEELHEGCPGVRYLTNAVNMRRFVDLPEPRAVPVVSWSGNAGHSNPLNEDVKGFHSVIVPACAQARVPLQYAEFVLNRVAPKDMPGFYREGNVTVCASLYEGASSSVMEAMAAGHAVVATDVGNHREMHESMLSRCGESGIILVDRSVEAFADVLSCLQGDPEKVREMGRINREEIALNWSWDVWADRFAEFLSIPLEGGAGQ